MGKDKFYKNSMIVTAANLMTGMLAFIFSIIISRKLGTEGMGLYGLVMPVYSLAICIVAEGLITAISKISAGYFSNKDNVNLHRTITTTIVCILIWAVFVSFVMFLLSGFLATRLINDSRTVYAIRILCPAIIIIPISAIFKGYFYGIGKFYVTSLIDICEKAMRVTFLSFATAVLVLENVQETVTSAFGAISLGEMISFTILFICYYKNSKYTETETTHKRESRPQLLANVLAISLPLCVNGILTSILSTASSLLLPRRLVVTGISYSDALSLIGKFSGMALNITLFPLIIVGSMSTVLVPDITTSLARQDFWSLEKRIKQVFGISLLIGVSTVIMNLIIPDELGQLFFKRDDLGTYISFAAVCSLLTYLAIPTYGMLNGLGRQKVILKNSLIVSVLEITLIFFLTAIPAINIYGLGITLVITSVVGLWINLREIKNTLEIHLSVWGFVKPLIIGALSFLFIKFISGFIPSGQLLLKCTVVVVSSYLLPLTVWKLSKYVVK